MNRCLQLFGGLGYSDEFFIERAWRDARLIRIGGGTDEVMREVISKAMGALTPMPGLEIGLEDAKERFAAIPKAGLFTEDHEEQRAVIRQWVEGRLAPHADEWEKERDFPYREVFKEAGGIGLFGAKYEEAYGGTGPDLIADAVITEETVRCRAGGVAAALGAHKDLGPLLRLPVRERGAAAALDRARDRRRGHRRARRHRAQRRLRRRLASPPRPSATGATGS